MSELWLAKWYHTWGECEGIAGVFSSQEKAWAALERLAPRCLKTHRAGLNWVSKGSKGKPPAGMGDQGVEVMLVVLDQEIDGE